MRLRLAALLIVLGAIGLFWWRAELFTVAKPGEAPRALVRTAGTAAAPAAFDVSLPLVPVGVARLTPGGRPLLVHYWAPWERHGRAQVLALDSLVRTLPQGSVRVSIVCFDPFPSVARYVGRLRLRVPVLLDLKRDLQAVLPCPSVPYTWLLDRRGRVVAAQPGEVEWLAPATRALLESVDQGAAADSAAAVKTTRPRRVSPGPHERLEAQARAVSASRRANQRARIACPPNSTALKNTSDASVLRKNGSAAV
jgi:hypothetical protein